MVSKSEAKGLIRGFFKKLRKKWLKWEMAVVECIIEPQSISDIQKKVGKGIKYYEDARKLLEKGVKEGFLTAYENYNNSGKTYWFVEDNSFVKFAIKVCKSMATYKRGEEKHIRIGIELGLKFSGKEIRKRMYQEFKASM